MIKLKNKKTFHNNVLKVFPEEACGFIIDNMYVKCKNTAEEPEDTFTIVKEDYVKAIKTGKLQALLHSHTVPLGTEPTLYDVRAPSLKDMETQEEMDVPWGIVTTEGENVSDILWFGAGWAGAVLNDVEKMKYAQLKGRRFIPNVFDCYTLIIDFYKLKHNITIRNYPREQLWEDYDPKMYDNNWVKEGFVKLDPWIPIEVDDILMFKVGRASYVNHAGVMLDGVTFIHHLQGKLSCKETFNENWRRRLAYVCRHKDFIK